MVELLTLFTKPIGLFYGCVCGVSRSILIDKHAELDVQTVKEKGHPPRFTACNQMQMDPQSLSEGLLYHNMENVDIFLYVQYVCVCASPIFSETMLAAFAMSNTPLFMVMRRCIQPAWACRCSGSE